LFTDHSEFYFENFLYLHHNFRFYLMKLCFISKFILLNFCWRDWIELWNHNNFLFPRDFNLNCDHKRVLNFGEFWSKFEAKNLLGFPLRKKYSLLKYFSDHLSKELSLPFKYFKISKCYVIFLFIFDKLKSLGKDSEEKEKRKDYFSFQMNVRFSSVIFSHQGDWDSNIL